MAGTAVSTISGAYLVSDKTGIAAFVTAQIPSLSSASIFIIPSGGNTCYVGVSSWGTI